MQYATCQSDKIAKKGINVQSVEIDECYTCITICDHAMAVTACCNLYCFVFVFGPARCFVLLLFT